MRMTAPASQSALRRATLSVLPTPGVIAVGSDDWKTGTLLRVCSVMKLRTTVAIARSLCLWLMKMRGLDTRQTPEPFERIEISRVFGLSARYECAPNFRVGVISTSGACELIATPVAAILHRRMPMRQEFSHTSIFRFEL